ncbi:MAG TPA: cohesin domain-containing protein [Thermoanaerobaculia bacterium]|nr:cohesin domain-containing protein [Thermoanaerobaculia bacterium]
MRAGVLRPWLAVLLILTLAGCGGGGGGGSPVEPTPPPPQPGVTFTGQGGSANNSVVLASGAGTNVNALVLEVRAQNVDDLYGAAFDLRFPAAVLQYARFTPGPLLEGGSVQVAPSGSGNLVVGFSRLGEVPGLDGSGVLLTLEFAPVAAGEGALSFARNSAFDSDGRPITGFTWAGGTVRVVR